MTGKVFGFGRAGTDKSHVCTLTYSTPVDHSDTGIDIDTSFSDMDQVQGHHMRKGGFKVSGQ